MHHLIAIALAAEPVPPPAAEPFFDTGGIHLVSIQASHGAALAVIFALGSDTWVYPPMDTGLRVAGTAGIFVITTGASILMARFLRPSVGAAWMTAVMSVATIPLGLHLGWNAQLGRRPRNSNDVPEPDYAVAMATSAGMGVVSSFISLLPPDRSRVSLWTTALIAGGTLTAGGVAYALIGSMFFTAHRTTHMAAIPFVAPIAALVLRLVQAALLPELFVTPAPIPGGAGLSFSGAW